MTIIDTAQSVQPAPGATRLTHRGRALALLSLVALLLAAFSLGRAASSASSSPVAHLVLQQTTVESGETLWSLAHRVAPGNDPREVVQEIRDINHLQGSSLQAGQQLLLPRAA